jgi:hypothetical protein
MSSNTNHHALLPAELRGIFGSKGDSTDWLDAMTAFPNGVPRFSSRAECLEFMQDYNTHHGGSNPSNPRLMHIFTMLTSWKEVESILIPNIHRVRKEPSLDLNHTKETEEGSRRSYNNNAPPPPPPSPPPPPPSSSSNLNVYEAIEAKPVVDAIQFRLNQSIHKCTTEVSTINTLKYLFFHMKCGIFVMIKNKTLRIFAPFVNKDYRNTWGDALTLEGDGSLDTYYTRKAGLYREENIEKDKSKWWANGNIICNEMAKPEDVSNMQYWGDQFLAALRDMLAEACRTRDIPDCEFFLNKRDYPQLKINVPKGIPVEPYGFIFDKDDRDPEQDVDLAEEHKFKTYAPIVSFYAASETRFADIPWPSSEDWEGACGLVFPHTFMHKKDSEGKAIFDSVPRDLFTEENFRKFERKWDDNRVATAFFRGTATGGGTKIENNQRLHLANLSYKWKDDPIKGGEEPYLDAAIVGWNMRDKKIASKPVTFLRLGDFDFTAGKHHFTPIYEQSKYKYLVYVDGHCAACRYGFMMRLGSVILKVESQQVADTMWYFPLLKPFVDYVPVKADLSDLEEKIKWCRDHDDECRKIAENAIDFYNKYVAKDALLDYVQMVCKNISKRFVKPPDWYDPPPPAKEPMKLRKPDLPCYEDKNTRQSRLCVRCKEEAKVEEEALQKAIAEEAETKKSKKEMKQSIRERMKRKAGEEKPKGPPQKIPRT